jgi:hypothetical protein
VTSHLNPLRTRVAGLAEGSPRRARPLLLGSLAATKHDPGWLGRPGISPEQRRSRQGAGPAFGSVVGRGGSQ